MLLAFRTIGIATGGQVFESRQPRLSARRILSFFFFLTRCQLEMGFGAKTILSALWGLALLHLVHAASFSPILPPSYPLAVRNPYLSSEFLSRVALDFD